MQNHEEQIGQLRELGLNTYEARAYLTLLGKESFSATQIADYSGVPRQRIYDILASLVDRGLVINRPGRRGTTYAAIAPKRALEALLHTEQQRLSKIEATTLDLIAQLGSLYTEGQEETSPLEYIEVLRGRASVNQRFAEIQANCKREILVFTKPPYGKAPQDNVEGIEALQRHVTARSLYEFTSLSDRDARLGIYAFIRRGEEARFVAALPLKLVIVDEEIVLFGMEDPLAGRTELTIVVIENPQLAQTLKLAFDALWAGGETFEATCARLGVPVPDE
jgi:sugar-specific transcriptional regulator TrmB